jgi:hypothetical protein
MLKQKIQKELEHRNVKQGLKGLEKDVEVKTLFEENEIDNEILEGDEETRNNKIEEEEDRDRESVGIVLKRYAPFIRKLFYRYSNISGARKDIS